MGTPDYLLHSRSEISQRVASVGWIAGVIALEVHRFAICLGSSVFRGARTAAKAR